MRERLWAGVPPALLMAFGRWICVRARLAEDVVERSVSDGVTQYVILGAGLDSFAYRRRDLLDWLQVFEIDHPVTQLWKRRRLGAIGVELPVGLVYAPVDFEIQTLREGLGGSGSGLTSMSAAPSGSLPRPWCNQAETLRHTSHPTFRLCGCDPPPRRKLRTGDHLSCLG